MSSSDPPSQYPDPYGQQQPYQYDPYSGQPYPYPQPQEYGGAYPPPMPPVPHAFEYATPPVQSPRNLAIGALVTNIVLTLLCCSPLGIAGIVVSALAMGRADHEPESAKRLVKWGWGLAIASVVAVIALIVVVLVVAAVQSAPQ